MGRLSEWAAQVSLDNDLVFKIDAIDGKKWPRFVAMQENSATQIYDLNTWKVQWRVTLKYSTAIQNSTIPSLKNRT